MRVSQDSAGEVSLAVQVAFLRQQMATLQRSHNDLREELLLEREARVALEQRLLSQSKSASPQADGDASGNSFVPRHEASPQRLSVGRQSIYRPSDMLAPSPRMLQRLRAEQGIPAPILEATHETTCSSASQSPWNAVGSEAYCKPGDSIGASPSRQSKPQMSAVGTVKSLPNNGNTVVAVEISQQLWAMEDRWRRICKETEDLRSVLEARQIEPVIAPAASSSPTR